MYQASGFCIFGCNTHQQFGHSPATLQEQETPHHIPTPRQSETRYRTPRLYTGACIFRSLRPRLGLGVPLYRVHPKLNQNHSWHRCSNHRQSGLLQARDQNLSQIASQRLRRIGYIMRGHVRSTFILLPNAHVSAPFQAPNLAGYGNHPEGYTFDAFVGGWVFDLSSMPRIFYTCTITLSPSVSVLFSNEREREPLNTILGSPRYIYSRTNSQ